MLARALLCALAATAAAGKKCKKAKSCDECMDTKHDFLGCGWCTKKNKCHERTEIDMECSLNCVGKLMDLPMCKRKCPAAPGPAPGPAPPAPSGGGASCIPGQGCVPCAGATCPYPSPAACQAACGAAPPPPAPGPAPAGSYACVQDQCVPASAGGVSRASCCAVCGGCEQYACVSGACEATSVGGVAKDACEAQCGGPSPPTPPAPVPPTPPAPPAPTPSAGGPKAGGLYCGSVGGGIILTTNLTIGADGSSMDYYNHIVIASTLIACPGEKYEFQAGVGCDPTVKGKAGCGTMDVTKTTSDPNDCLAKGGAAEGGAVHTFIYDGPEAATIEAKDSKYGTVEMKLSTNGKC